MFEDNNYFFCFVDKVCYFLYKIICFLRNEKVVVYKIKDVKNEIVFSEIKYFIIIYKDDIVDL